MSSTELKAAPISPGAPAALPVPVAPTLSPVDRVLGVIFGLIMALTFTGSLSVATADRTEVRSMLIGALGCNIAWGLVDAVMYLLGILAERGRSLAVLKEARSPRDWGRARELIAESMPPVLAAMMEPGELETIRGRLARLPEPPVRVGLTGGDLRAAAGVFLMVFLATLPVALPFLFLHEAHLALRVSNGIALLMLFVGGYVIGRHGMRHPWGSGLVTLGVGVLLVWATIALGG
jgi:VIT1/CCC1 family predicted Fe2+/Mn2+ transporter